MKHTLRVATDDPYCFIEAEYEGTPEEAVMAYQRLRHNATGGQGLGAKEFATIVHEYVTTGVIVNGAEGYGDYSVGQKAFLNEIKKLVRKDK